MKTENNVLFQRAGMDNDDDHTLDHDEVELVSSTSKQQPNAGNAAIHHRKQEHQSKRKVYCDCLCFIPFVICLLILTAITMLILASNPKESIHCDTWNHQQRQISHGIENCGIYNYSGNQDAYRLCNMFFNVSHFHNPNLSNWFQPNCTSMTCICQKAGVLSRLWYQNYRIFHLHHAF